jgi:transposase
VRDLEHQAIELAQIEREIKKMLRAFDYKLTTLPGVGNAVASKLIAEIGDIRRFPNADKLACFAGIALKSFSSADKGRDESNKQGNRVLHGLFYFLAVTMVCVTAAGKPTTQYSMPISSTKSAKARRNPRR